MATGTAKVERLLNLVICLLYAKQYVTAEYIRANVAGYQDKKKQSADAFNRMFERDKTELRDMGVPLMTGLAPGGTEGYRIDPDSYALPDISLERDEAAAVAMAAAVWDAPEVAALTQTAVLKLQAAGIDVRPEAVADVTTASASGSIGSEAVLAALLSAINSGRAVTFGYRQGAGSTTSTRTLEPWGVVTHRGRWYVVGHDRDRDDTRTFRLSRLSDVTPIGRRDAVQVDETADIQSIVAAAVDRAAGVDAGIARIWVAADRAAGLRRAARSATPETFDDEPGDVLEIDIRSLAGLARMVLGAGTDAVVLDPPDLRALVVAGLDRLTAATQ